MYVCASVCACVCIHVDVKMCVCLRHSNSVLGAYGPAICFYGLNIIPEIIIHFHILSVAILVAMRNLQVASTVFSSSLGLDTRLLLVFTVSKSAAIECLYTRRGVLTIYPFELSDFFLLFM
jgi:hypothetical protein